MEADTHAFLKEIESRRGAPVEWRTFSIWYGTSRHGGLERVWGVFLYRIGDTFYLEDFEHQDTFFGFPIHKRKDAKPFVRYEESFKCGDVKKITLISKGTAQKIATGKLQPEKVKPMNKIQALLQEHFTMVTLSDGSVMVFNLLDRKKFQQQLEIQQHNPS